ncbi:response regulator [Clostridium estertheticum]|uniref:response regulator n=1 Tax=Clostridium estertheticum TaxID=238834 RepID=UPI001C6F5002|nr:response regulator [Clostridium estertheticum]MBW9152307.1 response regulator [Clostridium estertheticum]WLC82834.1 response regulator [Clostridium estertheticum]
MNKTKVLFVDDELHILNSIKRSIIDEEIEPLLAMSGEIALKYFEENVISVIVTDMKMPNMSGLELLKKVKEISPNTIRIVLSGYTQLPQILATVNSVGVFRYVTKPWDDDAELLPALRDAISYYNIITESKVLKDKLEMKNKLYEKSLELNKNLVNQMSQTVSNIKNVSKFIMKVESTYLEELKENYNEIEKITYYNKLIGDLYINYLNKSLVDKERFNLKRFKEDLNMLVLANALINVDNEDFTYILDYKLIKFIVIESINFLINSFKLDNLVISIKSSPKFAIIITHTSFDFYNNYIENVGMKLFYSIIEKMLSTINGQVNFYPEACNIMSIGFANKD